MLVKILIIQAIMMKFEIGTKNMLLETGGKAILNIIK